MKSISANLNVMIKAAEKASKVLIRDFGEIENLQVSKKGPADFVTNSDLKVEKIIIDELKKARPNYSLISEESGFNVSKDKVWFMPAGDTREALHKSYPILFDWVRDNGFRMTWRPHIIAFEDQREV